jgi:signal transduction histidine kinase
MSSGRLPAAQQRSRGLIEAGLVLASEIDLEVLLQRIVEVAAEITGARYAALGVLDEDRRIHTFITHGITDEERAAIGDPPTGHGMLGLLIEEARPIRARDIESDPRSSGFPPNHPPMHSFLGAPVRARGRVFGNIYLTEKQDAPEFDQEDESALVVLAAQAGVAIENARLYEEMRRAHEELRRLELLEDRERIAKELHDGVIQSLFAVGMGLQGAAAMASDSELARRIENAVEDIDRSIRDLRNYIFGLRPGILADRQLDQALRELGSEFEGRSGVVTVVQVDEDVASELASRASDLVQITREALSNVGRHAHATTCRVTLRRDDGSAQLEIDDDGTGFDTETAREGLGLDNLRRRVEQLGGRLDLASVPGEGTTVTARLPL